jgi:hypothetical protein
MPTTGGDDGVSMGGYDYGVAILKYCYISAGSKDPLNLYTNLHKNLWEQFPSDGVFCIFVVFWVVLLVR